VFEQHRTLECEHSINGFHKQVNLVERTWNDDLRAMSCGLGIAIIVLLSTLQSFLNANGVPYALGDRSVQGHTERRCCRLDRSIKPVVFTICAVPRAATQPRRRAAW